jgi:hypothetical protein
VVERDRPRNTNPLQEVDDLVTLQFTVTYDYRCPFARNAHEHVLDGLESGADWDVRFLPFSLTQSKLEGALERAGVDVASAIAEVEGGTALKTLRSEHEWGVGEHLVWGVPTFIAGGQSVFVRLMDRPATSDRRPVEVIERVVDLLTGFPALNEFKHTSIPR